jgi:hypothetical protein
MDATDTFSLQESCWVVLHSIPAEFSIWMTLVALRMYVNIYSFLFYVILWHRNIIHYFRNHSLHHYISFFHRIPDMQNNSTWSYPSNLWLWSRINILFIIDSLGTGTDNFFTEIVRNFNIFFFMSFPFQCPFCHNQTYITLEYYYFKKLSTYLIADNCFSLSSFNTGKFNIYPYVG